ncbi:MAG: hypothetical protein PWP31_320 [Clostridia bacterium]|nr:hypothetical protein [Clostridia bacterium]
MNKPVIIIGGGGHAKVLIDSLKILKIRIIGITENSKKDHISEVKIIGYDDIILNYSTDEIELVNGLGSIATSKRRQLFETFKMQGYNFKSVIHPSTVIAQDVDMAEGVQIMAGAVIQTGTSIGDNTIINTKASVDHDCKIGAHVHIAPGATLSGGVQVGEGCHIGTGATIIQGVNIGKDSIIGAGAVVLNDVPAGVTVVGVPAKVVT